MIQLSKPPVFFVLGLSVGLSLSTVSWESASEDHPIKTQAVVGLHLRSLQSSKTAPLNEIFKGPSVGIIFQSECNYCREQIRSLDCLKGVAQVVLLGAYSGEPALRREVDHLKSPHPSYVLDADQLKKWGSEESITPQILITANAFRTPPKLLVGFKRCETILREVQSLHSNPAAANSEKAASSILPIAKASSRATASGGPRNPVVLSWDPVEGAEFYYLQISKSTDFSKLEFTGRVSDNFMVWTSFDNRVYYYRVAAGSAAKPGKFSSPERLDLTRWGRD